MIYEAIMKLNFRTIQFWATNDQKHPHGSNRITNLKFLPMVSLGAPIK